MGGAVAQRTSPRSFLQVGRLTKAGMRAADIGVITPYSAQVALLRDMRGAEGTLEELEISTVDGFQASANGIDRSTLVGYVVGS